MFIRSAIPSARQTIRTALTTLTRSSFPLALVRAPISLAPTYNFTSTRMSSTVVMPAGMFSNRYKIEDMPDLKGKVALVTGGSRGIGQAAVKALVQKGCEVHMVGATQEHLDNAIETISSEFPETKSQMVPHCINLESLSDVVSFGKELNTSLPRLDILYLIAGIGVAPYRLSKDGLSVHWSVNHLAHLVLVDQLLPKLKETSEKKNKDDSNDDVEKFSTRIVTESSELHRTAMKDCKLESLEEVNAEMDANQMYARSKLYGILLTKNLAQRLPTLTSPTPILAIAVHPGAVGTEQQQGAAQAYPILGKIVEAAGKTIFMTAEQGSESALWAGTAGQSLVGRREEVHGSYFTEADGTAGTESNQGKDSELIKRLWALSVKQLKETIGYELKL